MKLPDGWSRSTPVFDDENLVSFAGLVPVMGLAERAGLPELIDGRYDRGEADGRPYIAMEYLQGRTLKQVIQKEGQLPPERAIAIAMQVLAGLRYAHEHGVVHRDVKPHNVLVGDDGRIKVTDFGIAHAGDPQMTEVGSIVGTAQYLSPEQARGRTVGPQTDIYSLGVVLYEMLAGRVPFEGDSSVAIAMQHVSDAPPPLQALAPDVPDSLALVVAHAMLKEPSQRYGSADEFGADLDRVRRGLVPVAATAVTSVIPREPTEMIPAIEATRVAPAATPLLSSDKLPPSATPRKRSRWPWLLALLMLLAVGALTAFALGGVPGDDTAGTTATTQTTQETTAVTTQKLDDLVGQTYIEASATLANYPVDVTPRRQRVRDATQDANVVVAMVPEAGAILRDGDTVLLKVSRGQKPMPDVSGKTEAEAREELGADFTVNTQRRGQRIDRQGHGHPHRSPVRHARARRIDRDDLSSPRARPRCRCRTSSASRRTRRARRSCRRACWRMSLRGAAARTRSRSIRSRSSSR